MIRLDFDIALRHELVAPTQFVFAICAARTSHQRLVREACVLNDAD